MRTSTILAAVLPLLAALLVPSLAQPTPASAAVEVAVDARGSGVPLLTVQTPSLSGRWMLRMVTGQVTVEGTLEIEQRDGAVEGTWRPADDPDAEPVAVSGEIIDETLSLRFEARVPSDADAELYELVGAIGDDRDILAGTFSAPDGASGEWTARREDVAARARTAVAQTSLFSIA